MLTRAEQKNARAKEVLEQERVMGPPRHFLVVVVEVMDGISLVKKFVTFYLGVIWFALLERTDQYVWVLVPGKSSILKLVSLAKTITLP